MLKRTLKHFHFCCGLGGGAKGFNRAKPIVGNVQAEWQCIGGIDIDAAGLADFERLSGVKGTLLDLFTRDQYIRFHGKEPPPGWREATVDDIRRAANYQRPDAVFISSPCKGASGLLSEKMSLTPKYQALNELTLRCIWLFGEAWKDDPVPLLVFENVPRLATRGRHLLDQINKLLSHFGYAVAETTHDCGVIGGLAQSRKRFLLVARHIEKVPPFLYEPEKKTLKSVGSILGRMPLAGDVEAAGPMHRVPALQWKTWVRLALVTAGKDWRSLNDLAIEDGYLRDLVIVPEYRAGYLGVHDWKDTAGTVAGRSSPTNGAFSVADPRMPEPNDRLTCVIESLDGTWHRPFTTLELAALQSLVEPEEQFELDGLSDQAWRERIGNAVPPAAAEAIAHVMGTTLLLAAAGETFMLNSMPIWVRPVAVGLSVSQQVTP
ncbi:DNA cytosine methyltransferase [Pseudomonas koreensis]|uniref:DNA cytosine methyltransferase n=1 Tax=Pseudomonas koreensis TaxID=198620 RepID=UPI002076FFD7|nr:DNA cytosine methyltransferase [Pseudomonas koreensis]MCM8743587.1 DNA cytosine methyltransferase [Pseudomonas koreensis]